MERSVPQQDPPPPHSGWTTPQQPAPPMPPPAPWGAPPPQKKNKAGAAFGIGCAGVLALFVFVGMLLLVFDDGPTDDSAAASSSASASAGAAPDLTAGWPDKPALYPPEPNQQDRDAYIAALNAIDPDIVHGKEDKAVDRGRNQCRTVRDHPDDRHMLIEYTNKRFTSPNHPYPEGHGDAVSAQILDVVRTYICPAV